MFGSSGLTIGAYGDGLVDVGVSRIPPTTPQLPSYHGSLQNHLELLKCGRTVLNAISADSRVHDAAAPTLFLLEPQKTRKGLDLPAHVRLSCQPQKIWLSIGRNTDPLKRLRT